MNYNHLHYFYIVVKEGSISAASRLLHVSQPSLSSQIKSFEENLGVDLFARRGNKLELTSTGKSVYSHAAEMFELSENISEVVKNTSKQRDLPIRLGIADEIERPFAVNLAKSLFKKWKRERPPCITFTTGMNDELLSQLRSWAVDAVITNRPSSFDDLEITGTLVMPVCFATGSEVMKEGGSTALSYLAKDIPKLMTTLGKGLSVPSPRLKLREEIDTFLSKTRQAYPMTFESDTLATIARAIIDNIGVGFLPLPYISREVSRKEIVVFGRPEGLWKHTLFLMVKRGRSEAIGMAEISRAFEDLKLEVFKSLSTIEFSSTVEPVFKSVPAKDK